MSQGQIPEQINVAGLLRYVRSMLEAPDCSMETVKAMDEVLTECHNRLDEVWIELGSLIHLLREKQHQFQKEQKEEKGEA